MNLLKVLPLIVASALCVPIVSAEPAKNGKPTITLVTAITPTQEIIIRRWVNDNLKDSPEIVGFSGQCTDIAKDNPQGTFIWAKIKFTPVDKPQDVLIFSFHFYRNGLMKSAVEYPPNVVNIIGKDNLEKIFQVISP